MMGTSSVKRQRAVAIFAVTRAARDVAESLKNFLHDSKIGDYEVKIYHPADDGLQISAEPALGKNFAESMRQAFARGEIIVAICSTGIVIRALAPLLSDKMTEPPVLVIAQAGEGGASVIPLLGGHHGGNQFAHEIAAILGGRAVISNASGQSADEYSRPSLENPPPGWHLAAYDAPGTRIMLKKIYRQLAEGESPVFYHQVGGENGKNVAWLEKLGAQPTPNPDQAAIAIVTTVSPDPSPAKIRLYPPRLVLGVGASRGADGKKLIAWCERVLDEHQIAPAALVALASIDLKSDEAALHQLAAHYALPLRFFTAAQLLPETPFLTEPSDAVFQAVGCYGVAEAAALAACRDAVTGEAQGHLVIPKQKSPDATLAVAIAPHDLRAAAIGQGRGSLTVVGIGPGAAEYRSLAANQAIAQADQIVGYGLYLDLIADLVRPWQKRVGFPLGAERARVEYAVSQAALGQNIALVSSGDAGIYALASLACEFLAESRDPAHRRLEFSVIPGISAMQSLAAKLGGAIGHDFAAISLSDLLTPWPVIAQRLHHAAAGDFVIALYNPRSERRDWQLAAALDIIRPFRPATTPVAIGQNLGRSDENCAVTDLAGLQHNQARIDMMTVIIIGNISSRQFRLGDRKYMFTPRGYEVTNSKTGEKK
ncbi:MAG: precorrin-3B C(17)-methyltransferase [Candidatus Symbiobacter sp.]|nr:precorrin-3B C(17)-methyltransferase [Candidatus Symbiobacter sp.]